MQKARIERNLSDISEFKIVTENPKTSLKAKKVITSKEEKLT